MMMNLTRPGSAIATLAVGLAALTAPVAAVGQELPPAMEVDRLLLQAGAHIRDGDPADALSALDRILELRAEHGVEIPDDFWFRHAEAALATGNAERGQASALRYLEMAGREGEHYLAALELFNEAEALQTRFPPGTSFSDCDVCPQMVVVPAGTFTMGSPTSEEGRYDDEGPQHSVTIPAPFAVGVYEVTFAEWDACVRARACGGYVRNSRGRERRPVNDVSWDDAQAYASWLSQQTGARYRLLSEAEWEYVARAGSVTARYWGESESGRCRYANGFDVACSDGYESTAPVGSFAPNAFGLYDVLGNVWEWTQDCWNASYADAPADGSAWMAGDCGRRVLRGGSRETLPGELRSALRFGNTTNNRWLLNGFRVARTLN